jgi:hypothetical protein
VAAEAAVAAVAAARPQAGVADAVARLRFLPFPGLRRAQHRPLTLIPRQRLPPVAVAADVVEFVVALLLPVPLRDKQAEAVDEAVQPRPLRQRARL